MLILGTIATVALSMDYNRREGINAPEAHVLILLATAGMMLLAAARDMMVVFLGIETMSIGVYVMCAMRRRSRRGNEAAMKYFLIGAFATGFLMYGMALLYGAAWVRVRDDALSGAPSPGQRPPAWLPPPAPARGEPRALNR